MNTMTMPPDVQATIELEKARGDFEKARNSLVVTWIALLKAEARVKHPSYELWNGRQIIDFMSHEIPAQWENIRMMMRHKLQAWANERPR